MSEKLPVSLTPQDAALLGFAERDFARFAARARKLRADLRQMEAEISEAVLIHEGMLDELSRKLLTAAGGLAQRDVELALKTAIVGMKAHAEWRELIAPLARSLGERIRAIKTARPALAEGDKAEE